MNISLIVAMDKNGVIGKDNTLPWHLPADLENVKRITSGTTIVMGRKNYESIGRPLPNRRNIILTRNRSYMVTGCEICYDLVDVINTCRADEDIMIFGGTEVYRMFLPYVKTMYVTKIDHEFDGDTFFPEVDWDEWVEVVKEKKKPDDRNRYPFTFYIYERKEIES